MDFGRTGGKKWQDKHAGPRLVRVLIDLAHVFFHAFLPGNGAFCPITCVEFFFRACNKRGKPNSRIPLSHGCDNEHWLSYWLATSTICCCQPCLQDAFRKGLGKKSWSILPLNLGISWGGKRTQTHHHVYGNPLWRNTGLKLDIAPENDGWKTTFQLGKLTFQALF